MLGGAAHALGRRYGRRKWRVTLEVWDADDIAQEGAGRPHVLRETSYRYQIGIHVVC
jgi:hypothetical protein